MNKEHRLGWTGLLPYVLLGLQHDFSSAYRRKGFQNSNALLHLWQRPRVKKNQNFTYYKAKKLGHLLQGMVWILIFWRAEINEGFLWDTDAIPKIVLDFQIQCSALTSSGWYGCVMSAGLIMIWNHPRRDVRYKLSTLESSPGMFCTGGWKTALNFL